ncbi:MAG: hypothetical protein HY690_02005 [Chloroflexi bacterium]|nr:hypothetical protein [Chloroflexota bacterium]
MPRAPRTWKRARGSNWPTFSMNSGLLVARAVLTCWRLGVGGMGVGVGAALAGLPATGSGTLASSGRRPSWTTRESHRNDGLGRTIASRFCGAAAPGNRAGLHGHWHRTDGNNRAPVYSWPPVAGKTLPTLSP